MNEGTLIARLNTIAAEIRHEDDLIGARVSWLMISQSFLFGTFVALVGLKGAVVPVLVLMAVVAATYAISQWRAELDRICELPEAQPLDWPDLKHRRLVTLMGHLLPIAGGLGFLLAWIVILIKMGRV